MGLLAKINSANLIFVGLVFGASSIESPMIKEVSSFNIFTEEHIKEIVEEQKIDLLLEAIIQVESRGKEECIGDKHLGKPSIGVLQIRPIMVREVNRLLKKRNIKKKYKLDDRYSREKSIEMFYIWKDYYHSEDSNEVTARCWNGGPNGWKKKATEYYWTKVQKELKLLTVGSSM